MVNLEGKKNVSKLYMRGKSITVLGFCFESHWIKFAGRKHVPVSVWYGFFAMIIMMKLCVDSQQIDNRRIGIFCAQQSKHTNIS